MSEENKKPIKLTPKQRLFVAEYLESYNATKAAIKAGYSEKTAAVMGHENLRKPNIKAAIGQALDEAVGDPQEKIKRHIRELEMIAYSDIKDFMSWDKHGMEEWINSDDVGAKSRLIQEISQTSTQNGGSKKMKLHDKRWAFDMLGKYYGFLKESVEITNPDGNLTPVVNINIPLNKREKKSE